MASGTVGTWVRGAALAVLSGVAMGALAANSVEPEVSDVATLPPAGPHRFITTAGFGSSGFTLFDGDSGKMEGNISAGYIANLAVAPDSSQYFVSETYWSRGTRGDRTDVLTIYDGKTLDVLKEVLLPGRALGGGGRNFATSASGTRAYQYIMHPAASVAWIDLKQQVLGGVVEIPGCAEVFPFGDEGFSALCGDGTLATVTISPSGATKLTHSKPFFDANKDPVYDESLVDRVGGKALFLSYTGLIYPAKLGPEPVIEKPWSIQQAAGLPVAGTGINELAWRPGGRQLAAYHIASGRLFVLMHMGNYWTQKEGGTELWVLDAAKHTLISRFHLWPVPTSGLAKDRPPYYANVAVTQDAKPVVILTNSDGNDTLLDATTGAVVKKIEFAAGASVVVPGY